MKVLVSIDDCKKCDFSSHLTRNGIDYSVIVCDKTRSILAVTEKDAYINGPIAIPCNCPLPDCIEDKH